MSSSKKVRKLATVTKFPRAHVEPMDPEPRVIHHCERLLADAKSGKLRAIAYAVVHRDDLSPAGAGDHGYCAGSGTYYAVTHVIERLARAWGRHCDEEHAYPIERPLPPAA